jgi:hypothetical protein
MTKGNDIHLIASEGCAGPALSDGCDDNFPTYHLLYIQHIADVHPRPERVGHCVAVSEAGFKANGIDCCL